MTNQVKNKRINYIFLSMLLVGAIFLMLCFSVTIGSVSLKTLDVWKIIVNKIFSTEIYTENWDTSLNIIVWTLRVPRVLVAILAGASLAFVGILMQCLTKNPLASPYILGISSGASTGAVLAIVFLNETFASAVPIFAFIAGVVTVFLVFLMAGFGEFSTTKLVLVGVAFSAFFSAITTLVITIAPNERKIRDALFWMAGGLSGSNWHSILPMFLVLLLSVILIYPKYRELNILVTGDENALVLGVNIKAMRTLIVLTSTLLVGYVVSNTGIIGFVGLIVPHIARKIVGENHKKLIPISILIGALFLLVTDTLTRGIFRTQEIPIGVITSLFGVPFFLNILRKKSYKFGGE
ncbi:MAG: iron ABC transporter permease [Fusobacterium sp.]|nr:iron ABC transporter permease [Fusobacterium sp.]